MMTGTTQEAVAVKLSSNPFLQKDRSFNNKPVPWTSAAAKKKNIELSSSSSETPKTSGATPTPTPTPEISPSPNTIQAPSDQLRHSTHEGCVKPQNAWRPKQPNNPSDLLRHSDHVPSVAVKKWGKPSLKVVPLKPLGQNRSHVEKAKENKTETSKEPPSKWNSNSTSTSADVKTSLGEKANALQKYALGGAGAKPTFDGNHSWSGPFWFEPSTADPPSKFTDVNTNDKIETPNEPTKPSKSKSKWTSKSIPTERDPLQCSGHCQTVPGKKANALQKYALGGAGAKPTFDGNRSWSGPFRLEPSTADPSSELTTSTGSASTGGTGGTDGGSPKSSPSAWNAVQKYTLERTNSARGRAENSCDTAVPSLFTSVSPTKKWKPKVTVAAVAVAETTTPMAVAPTKKWKPNVTGAEIAAETKTTSPMIVSPTKKWKPKITVAVAEMATPMTVPPTKKWKPKVTAAVTAPDMTTSNMNSTTTDEKSPKAKEQADSGFRGKMERHMSVPSFVSKNEDSLRDSEHVPTVVVKSKDDEKKKTNISSEKAAKPVWKPGAASVPAKRVGTDNTKKQSDPLRHTSHEPPKKTSMGNTSRSEFTMDGRALPHWDRSNFELERDSTCRYVYKPKENDFFEKILKKQEFDILRKTTIEQPYFSKYNRFFPQSGHFCCKACGNELYSSLTKFNAYNGWPAFGGCVEGAIEISEDTELGDGILEMHCHRCKSHIGNVVEEHNKTLYGEFFERHRVNGQSIKYGKLLCRLSTNFTRPSRLSLTLLF
jgi:peptide-methionine (R)-S-oxide reductase